MRVLLANIEEVFREAAARWTLLAYFTLSTMFVLVFAAAINLDIVDGALAGAKLFGKEVEMGPGGVPIEQLVIGFESGFSGVLFVVGTFLAIFSTAHLVPRLQEKGTVDLYLSRPVGRVRLLLSRYIAGLALAALNVFYLVGAIWLIVIYKTHIVHLRFLLGAVVILFSIATLLALAFLIGVVTSSTAVSIMGTYACFFLAMALAGHERMEAAVSSWWSAKAIHGSYLILPKVYEMMKAVVSIVAGDAIPNSRQVQEIVAINPMSFVSTGLFAVACLTLASFLFRRKEF